MEAKNLLVSFTFKRKEKMLVCGTIFFSAGFKEWLVRSVRSSLSLELCNFYSFTNLGNKPAIFIFGQFMSKRVAGTMIVHRIIQVAK